MAISAEQRSKFNGMVTSAYEWKFLEWDIKSHTNTQTNNLKYAAMHTSLKDCKIAQVF